LLLTVATVAVIMIMMMIMVVVVVIMVMIMVFMVVIMIMMFMIVVVIVMVVMMLVVVFVVISVPVAPAGRIIAVIVAVTSVVTVIRGSRSRTERDSANTNYSGGSKSWCDERSAEACLFRHGGQSPLAGSRNNPCGAMRVPETSSEWTYQGARRRFGGEWASPRGRESKDQEPQDPDQAHAGQRIEETNAISIPGSS
jgi:hypothetical protein